MSSEEELKERLILAKAAAKILGLRDPQTVTAWQRRGWIPFVRVGPHIWYDRVALTKWIEGGGGPPVDTSMPTANA